MARSVVISGTPITLSATSRSVILGGIVGGIIGGLLMAVVMMIYAALALGSMWTPLVMLGTTFIGSEALNGGAGILLWGVILHMCVSAALGVVFAEVTPPTVASGAAVAWGMLYGLAVFVVMTFLILQWVNPIMFGWAWMNLGAWVTAHLAFGLGVATTPALVRGYAAPVPPRRVEI